MTKYTPKEFGENVNVAPHSPIKEFLLSVIKVAGVLIVLYVLLGILVEFLVPRIPIGLEAGIGKIFSRKWADHQRSEQETSIQTVLDQLLLKNPALNERKYQVFVVKSKEANAFALPGGTIVILEGLLKEIKSENELAMILAHELGHFAHRDHLRGLGRGLVFLVFSSALLGPDSSVSRFITSSMSAADTKFSQDQELAADAFALDLLYKTYGHVAGAVDFFERSAREEKFGKIFYFLATHPYPDKRIEILQKEIVLKNYEVREKKSLKFVNNVDSAVSDRP